MKKLPDSFHDRVVALLPSESLKEAVKKTNHRFSKRELLSIIYYYAPSFDERIALLGEILPYLAEKTRDFVKNVIDAEIRQLEEFKKSEPNAVFELCIKDTPRSHEERYLCASYEGALRMIDRYYEEYGHLPNTKPTDETRYRIEKRRILDGKDFSEDLIGEVILRQGKVVDQVEFEGGHCLWDFGEDGRWCWNCPCARVCLRFCDVVYPCFTANLDPVIYTLNDGRKFYGIVLREDDEPTREIYIIPIDTEAFHYHDFEDLFYGHQHMEPPLVEKLDPSDLPEEIRKDYFAYMDHLKSNPEKAKSQMDMIH